MKKIIFKIIFISFLISFHFFSVTTVHALNAEQIKQIEDIAQQIAEQANKNSAAMINDMTVSFTATAVSRNVIYRNVLRVKKGLSPAQLREYQNDVRKEIVPGVCKQNANNPAFSRGLYYTFLYENTYGEKLAEIIINENTCRKYK